MAQTDVDDIFPNPDNTIKFSNNSDTFLDEEIQGSWIPELEVSPSELLEQEEENQHQHYLINKSVYGEEFSTSLLVFYFILGISAFLLVATLVMIVYITQAKQGAELLIDLQEDEEEDNIIKEESNMVLQKVKSNHFTQRPTEINSYCESLWGQILNLSTIFYEYVRRPFDEKFIQIS